MISRSIGALAILIGGVCVTAARGQGDTPAPETSTTTEAQLADGAGKIKAQVILVHLDWSGDDGVEGAEEILQSLLQDVPVPTSYTSLAANAPRMLFPTEFLSIYDPLELTSSIVWMANRDLVHQVWEMSAPEDEEGAGERGSGTQRGPSYTCSIFIDQEALPLPSGPIVSEAPPYVHRAIGTELRFQSSLRMDDGNAATGISVIATRTLQVRDEFKNAPGEPGSVNIKSLGSERFSFDMPLDRVAVFPFYHAGKRFSQESYPIVIIMPAALDIPDSASDTLSKPSALANIRPIGNRTRPSLSRSPVGGTRTPSAPARADESPATEIKVFSLQHAKASSAVDVLAQLLEKGNFVAEERTNSVIARGAGAELEIAETLLMQIDRPTAASSEDRPAGASRDRPSLDEFRRSLRGQYSTSEEQALSVAQTLAAEKDAAAARRLRERLQIVVTESFGLRQELQQAELELLRERIRGIETQLRQREHLRDEIIHRRVEQLASGEPPSRSAPPDSSSGKPRDLSAASHLSVSGVTTLRGPEEFRRVAEEVSAEIKLVEGVRYKFQEQEGQPGTRYDDKLAGLRQRLALLRDEYAAQLRLLELEVQAAAAGLKTARRAVERTTALFERGQLASNEMDQATLSHEQAKVRSEKAQTLLDLYLKAGAATELLKPAAESGDAANGEPTSASVRSPATDPGDAVVWVEAIVPTAQDPDKNEAVYGNGVVVSANGLIVVTLGRGLSRLPKDVRENFRATVSVPNAQRGDARIVLLDENSSLALLKVDAGDWPYLVCHSGSLALRQQLSVVSRGGANHTPTSDAAEVAATLEPTDTDVAGAIIQLNRGFPRVNSGAATIAAGGRLAGFLAIPPDGQQGLVVPAARAVELLTIYDRAMAVEESDDPAADDTRQGGVSVDALPEEGILILRGRRDSVQRVINTFEQTEQHRSAVNEQPADASRNASPE